MSKFLLLYIFFISTQITGQTKPYSKSKTDGQLVFLSGEIADGNLIKSGDIESQVKNIMEKIGKELSLYNLYFDDILKTTIFTTNLSKYSSVNKIYSSFFTNSCVPARDFIGVKELPFNAQIEISVIARFRKHKTNISRGIESISK